MPRTLSATLTTALDSGNYTFYSLLTVKEVGFAVIRTAQPVSFKLSGIEMDVKYSALDHDVYDGFSYPEDLSFMLTRGVTIAGVNYTIDSSYYFGVSSEWDGVFETIHASMLPNTKYSVAGDGTYKAVLDAICVANGKTAVYKNPTAAWLSYQFLPTGKTLDMNRASNLLNLIKQKYLIYACDNGSDQILFCSVASDSTALNHTLNIEKLKLNLGNPRRFLSRDEASVLHYSGNVTAPLWNLGFLHSTAAHPAFSNSGGIEILPIAPHLKYLSFDNFQFNFAVNYPDITYESTSILLAWVEEVFDPKEKIAWHIKVSSLHWGKGAEGGALPSTIERVAAYTPLVSTGFDGNLSPAVNNLQAFAQAVDDLDIPALANLDADLTSIAALAGTAGLLRKTAANTWDLATTLILPATNVLTILNAAAAKLSLNITATKTLTLTCVDDYNLTIPGTGVVALLGIENIFTVNQTWGNGTGNTQHSINGGAGFVRDLIFKSGGTARWIFRVDSTAESGANVGSDWLINSRADDGTGIATPFFMKRSNGYVRMGGVTAPTQQLSVTGNADVSGVYKVDNVQVVSNRVVDARCNDTINTAAWDATTAGVLDSLRDAMITHGLIAAA